MIKQILDFYRDGDPRAAVIEVFAQIEDPQKHLQIIKDLVEDGAILQDVDDAVIRAIYRGTNQDKLLSLIEDGWSFSGQDVAEEAELHCEDQQAAGKCGECISPCPFEEDDDIPSSEALKRAQKLLKNLSDTELLMLAVAIQEESEDREANRVEEEAIRANLSEDKQ